MSATDEINYNYQLPDLIMIMINYVARDYIIDNIAAGVVNDDDENANNDNNDENVDDGDDDDDKECEEPLSPDSYPPKLQSSGPVVLDEVPDFLET